MEIVKEETENFDSQNLEHLFSKEALGFVLDEIDASLHAKFQEWLGIQVVTVSEEM